MLERRNTVLEDTLRGLDLVSMGDHWIAAMGHQHELQLLLNTRPARMARQVNFNAARFIGSAPVRAAAQRRRL